MANVRQSVNKRQDRTNFCARCGVTFLWTAEEQAAGEARPTTNENPAQDTPSDTIEPYEQTGPENPARAIRPKLCPGCRQLLPPTGRERGLVKWYNRRKRFGFITRKDQPDLFVHGSTLADRQPLYPDMLVEFSIQETDRGLAADRVEKLEIPASDTDEAGDQQAP